MPYDVEFGIAERLRERRSYSAPWDYHAMLHAEYSAMATHGEVPSIMLPEFDPATNVVTAADMALRSPGTQQVLASSWGLTLPDDYLWFCSQFSSYLLVARNPIKLLSAREIEETTVGLRSGEGIEGNARHRIFRFATIVGQPVHFSLRWIEEMGKPQVVFSRYTDTTEADLLGANQSIYSCDDSFLDWWKRMVSSDGFPLHPEHSDEADALVARAGNVYLS